MMHSMPWGLATILLPLAGGLLALLLPRMATTIALSGLTLLLGAVLAFGWQMLEAGPWHHDVGGWGAPLGIALMADGLSLLMLAMTALVGLTLSLYAMRYFCVVDLRRFWPPWLLLLAALNVLFLSADLFNLYVALELVGLAAVGLTALQGGRAALTGAMRYLLATLLGSLLYLLGVALLYHSYATVDLRLLADAVDGSLVDQAAFALMCTGLVLKTALFPMHFWLPPAHASAAAPVSAALSGLVVKASFYLLLRLWLELYAGFAGAAAELLGMLGAAAVVWGSLQALVQTRVKLLVAYSTVAQIGYLFLGFPLAQAVGPGVWYAVIFLAFSHALAKAAMFMAAGNVMHFGGHDRIADLDRVAQRQPLTIAAFAVAGASIMGMPPTGGFNGKWLLLDAALQAGRWDLILVLVLGGVLAGAYVFKVLGFAFTQAPTSEGEPRVVALRMEWAAMLLAICAVLTGLFATPFLDLLGIGGPFDVERLAQ